MEVTVMAKNKEAVVKEEAAVKTESTAKEEAVAKKEATAKAAVYLGASIPGTALSYGNIYSNGYPDSIKNLMVAIPEIKPLMIEVSKAVEVKAELKVKGSYASTLYEKLIKKLGGN
jgi:hypothetical protein